MLLNSVGRANCHKYQRAGPCESADRSMLPDQGFEGINCITLSILTVYVILCCH